jgi:uncharacterized membrane protein YedE/YeeE
MHLDWNAFTPWSALSGGALIGLSAVLLALLNGRIAGISGILGGLLQRPSSDTGWRAVFMVGLLGASWVYVMIAPMPDAVVQASDTSLVVAGLLVGVGTRYGAGCTSGHGVCGLSRLSPRSLVATAAFMGSGFVTVYVLRHLMAVA